MPFRDGSELTFLTFTLFQFSAQGSQLLFLSLAGLHWFWGS